LTKTRVAVPKSAASFCSRSVVVVVVSSRAAVAGDVSRRAAVAGDLNTLAAAVAFGGICAEPEADLAKS
jgi:hypothetical protein